MYDEANVRCICPALHKVYCSGKNMLFNGYRVASFKAAALRNPVPWNGPGSTYVGALLGVAKRLHALLGSIKHDLVADIEVLHVVRCHSWMSPYAESISLRKPTCTIESKAARTHFANELICEVSER